MVLTHRTQPLDQPAPQRDQLQEDTRLLTADQVSERLGVPRTWVYARARTGRIPAVRLGRYYRFRPQAIEAWILEQEGVSQLAEVP